MVTRNVRNCTPQSTAESLVCFCDGIPQARIAAAVGAFLPGRDMDALAYFLHTGLCMARSELERGQDGFGEWLPTPPPPGSACRPDPMILFVVRDDAKLLL